MKKVSYIIYGSIFLFACAPIATNPTVGSAGTSTGPTNTPVKTSNSVENETFTVYTKHSAASPLLSREKLNEKKIFQDLNDAFLNPAEVFRIKLYGIDKGFDMLSLTPRIGELYNLQEIEITGVYESLPKEIGKLTQLQFVTISLYNLKNELPKEIANWKNIQSLTIENSYSSADIQAAPLKWSSVQLLTNLKSLRMDGKEIVHLPENLGNFKNLENLHLTNLQKITSIPELTNCENLKRIEIYKLDALSKLPENLGNKKTLKNLEVTGCLKLGEFSPTISGYDLLYIRAIGNPKLTLIPAGFEKKNQDKNGFTCQKPLIKTGNGEEEYITVKNNEIEFYANINRYKRSVQSSVAILTKDKSLVKIVELNYVFVRDSSTLFLNEIDKYPNLEEIQLVCDENSNLKFDKDIQRKIRKLHILSFHDYQKNQNWTEILSWINHFKNLESLEVEGNCRYLDGNSFNFPSLLSLNIQGVGLGESYLMKDISKLLLSAPNLENLTMNVATDYIPNEIYKLTKLKKIDIIVWDPKVNYQCVIPKEIGNLKNLEHLRLLVNDYQTAVSATIDPAVNSLVKLKFLELNLSGENKQSKAFTYPNGIENLALLETLKLSLINATPTGLEKLKLKEKVISTVK